jgi:cysteine-rich repeat protein
MARTLAGVFCFTVALSWCVASADAYSVSAVGLESPGAGSILEVDIILDTEDQTLYGYIIDIYFDPTVLSIVSGTYHPIEGEALSSLFMYPDHWYITMTSWGPTGPVNQSVATLVFHVMDVPASTMTSLDPNVVTLLGHDGTDQSSTTTVVPLEIHVSDCGDGTIVSAELCDDGGTTPGDGCDETCQVETGWDCLGQPSACSGVCGDGLVVSAEPCDDGGTTPGDGCDETCHVETSWTCAGEPSVCTLCGDGIIEGLEACDDGGTASGDGCHVSCQIEPAWRCVGEPSACTKMLPALSPWSQVALVAGLLGAGLGLWRRRGASPTAT